MLLATKRMASDEVELKTEGDEAGKLVARFSTFNNVDSHGDIVRSSALKEWDNSEIALVWSHNWDEIIGKGVIKVKGNHANFDGEIFLDIPEGEKAYKVMKKMGKLQEYSWGFRILEYKPIKEKDENGEERWTGGFEITKVQPYEVSPVLKGANPVTGTLSIKGMEDAAQVESRQALYDAVTKDAGVVDEAITDENASAEVADTNLAPLPEGQTLDEESKAALEAVEKIVARLKAHADLKAAEGRSLSDASKSRLQAHLDAYDAAAKEIRSVLESVQPQGVSGSDRFRKLALHQRQYQFIQLGEQ